MKEKKREINKTISVTKNQLGFDIKFYVGSIRRTRNFITLLGLGMRM